MSQEPQWFKIYKADGTRLHVVGLVMGEGVVEKVCSTTKDLLEFLGQYPSHNIHRALDTETPPKILSQKHGYEEWIPFAKRTPFAMVARGEQRPQGLIVHWTAGRPRDSAVATMEYGKNQGYFYLCIDATGQLWQSNKLSDWGWHTGNAAWDGLDSPARQCVGVEVCCAGKVTPVIVNGKRKFAPWYALGKDGQIVSYADLLDESDVREDKDGWDGDHSFAGWYHKYTEAQEATLKRLCLWLKENDPQNFKLEWVLGHDEIALPHGRKTDPGASLTLGMPKFREDLLLEWQKKIQ